MSKIYENKITIIKNEKTSFGYGWWWLYNEARKP